MLKNLLCVALILLLSTGVATAKQKAKKIYLGLAITSHNTKEAATAVFNDISLIK